MSDRNEGCDYPRSVGVKRLSLEQSVYTNPNQRMECTQLRGGEKDVEYYGQQSSYRNSNNTESINHKIPRVIFEVIAQKTRQQNYIRIRSSKQFNRRRSLFNPNRKSLLQSISKHHADFIIQQVDHPSPSPLHPTGNMRRSLTGRLIPQLDTRLSSKHKLICPICLVQGPIKQFISICNNECQHRYCRSCMHQYVIYKIKMFEKVTCPDESCKVMLKLTSGLYAELPIDTRQRFKKILQYDEVMNSDSKRICPNERCDGVLDVSNSENNPCCESCGIVYCRKCFFPNHAGQCDSFQLKFFQQTLNYRQCSNCKNIIEKNQGCNHMTCMCGYQFCYLCGKKWTNTHMCQQLQQNNIDQPYIPDRWQCCCCQCTQCEFCQPLDYCCECMCFDEWEICRIMPIRWFFKLIIILIVMVVGMPMWVCYIVFYVVITFFMGVILGLFVAPYAVLSGEVDVSCWWVMLGVVFFPITIIVLIVMGVKKMFVNDEWFEDIMQQLTLPIDVVNEIIDL